NLRRQHRHAMGRGPESKRSAPRRGRLRSWSMSIEAQMYMLGPGWSAEDELFDQPSPAAQAANRFSNYLRRVGFWPTQHFTLRFLERAQPLGLDPRTFRNEFFRARHFVQIRPGYNTRVALIRDIPVLYRPSGWQGERIRLIGLLPQGALPPTRPIRRPRERET